MQTDALLLPHTDRADPSSARGPRLLLLPHPAIDLCSRRSMWPHFIGLEPDFARVVISILQHSTVKPPLSPWIHVLDSLAGDISLLSERELDMFHILTLADPDLLLANKSKKQASLNRNICTLARLDVASIKHKWTQEYRPLFARLRSIAGGLHFGPFGKPPPRAWIHGEITPLAKEVRLETLEMFIGDF